MFLGHHAAALAAKRVSPKTSLGTLVTAATLLDLIWPILLLAGAEHVRIVPGTTVVTPLDFYDYPWTHSLLMVCVWALLFGVGYRLFTTYTRGAAIVAGLVISHWLLDAIVHRPDLPLWPHGPAIGLSVWNSKAATITIELLLLIAGVGVYARATHPRDRVGRWSFVCFVAFLLVIYAANIAGPPPPNEQVIAWGGLAAFLLPLWAFWFDRHREVRT